MNAERAAELEDHANALFHEKAQVWYCSRHALARRERARAILRGAPEKEESFMRGFQMRACTTLLATALTLAASGVGASGAPAKPGPAGTLEYFVKVTGQSFTTPSGAPVSQSQPLAAGDILFLTEDLYAGTNGHHASTSTASAFLYCTLTGI